MAEVLYVCRPETFIFESSNPGGIYKVPLLFSLFFFFLHFLLTSHLAFEWLLNKILIILLFSLHLTLWTEL
ncbi:hypothetical protein BC941DRAFT_439428 [Chlamydoabsidia padenii]|nr:hypothetical protein BC941DRAFT_439428 [Chlamydoabsidia padenii]